MQSFSGALNPTVVSIAFGAGIGLSTMLISWVIGRAAADIPRRSHLSSTGRRLDSAWCGGQLSGLLITSGRLIPPSRRQAALIKCTRQASTTPCRRSSTSRAAWLPHCLLQRLLPGWPRASFSHQSGTHSAGGIRLSVSSHLAEGSPSTHAKRLLLKQLPFYLDIITLCVEAGLNLTGAFEQAMRRAPSARCAKKSARILRDVRAGKSRTDALRTFARAHERACGRQPGERPDPGRKHGHESRARPARAGRAAPHGALLRAPRSLRWKRR